MLKEPISYLHFLAHCDVIEQPAKTDTLTISDHKGLKASWLNFHTRTIRVKSKKSEKRKESATPKGNYTGCAEIRQCPVCILDGAPVSPRNAPLQKRRGMVFVHRSQLMTLGTFQAVKFGGSKGGPGASEATWGGSGVRAGRWRTVVAKRASRRRVGRSGQAT